MARRLRMGMVGGGRGAMIGSVHRIAATMDGMIELTAGALSQDPERARASGQDLCLAEDRIYESYEELIQGELTRGPDERIDFISIVTPNHMHYPVAKLALESGFPVVCEKPMTFNVEEALLLEDLVRKSDLPFALTHNYGGYPLIKQARQMVADGTIGNLRKVVVEYSQGWLASKLEDRSHKQADWRTDPRRAGASCCMGDIGIHAAHLLEYVSGQNISQVSSQVSSIVEGRQLDDDVNVLIKTSGGAVGVLMASQIAIGEENHLRLRLYGDRGAIDWCQEEPNSLTLKWPDRPRETLRSGRHGLQLCEAASMASRLPSGHPEGYLEGFANIYQGFARALQRHLSGEDWKAPAGDFPGVREGVQGMKVIHAVLASSRSHGEWTKVT